MTTSDRRIISGEEFAFQQKRTSLQVILARHPCNVRHVFFPFFMNTEQRLLASLLLLSTALPIAEAKKSPNGKHPHRSPCVASVIKQRDTALKAFLLPVKHDRRNLKAAKQIADPAQRSAAIAKAQSDYQASLLSITAPYTEAVHKFAAERKACKLPAKGA
jgi:hypothetical protein